MNITQLEINNFKSFSGVTKIPFFEGFTVISGPNGSGKSNIIDSVLFVLALAGSTSLRAEKLTDLINLNSGKNIAEVEVIFSDGTKIRRRIKRASHGYYSYYYLNDRVSSHSEILEFLAKFGIKPEGYNVVMQGDITRVMEMSDNERRKIIDEIAGVAEFEAKKEQALAELEVVRERIEREELVLRELKSRLDELEQERGRAVEYRRLQEDIAKLEGCRKAATLRGRESEHAALLQVIGEKDGELEHLTEDRGTREKKLVEKSEALKKVEEQINQKSGAEYLQLVSGIEERKSSIKVTEQTIEKSKKEKEKNQEDLNRVYLDLKRAETRVKECTDLIRNLSIDRANLSMDLATRKAEVERIEKEISTHGKEIDGAKDHLLSLMKEVEGQKESRAGLLHEQDTLIEKSRLRTTEIERLEGLIKGAENESKETNEGLKGYAKAAKDAEAKKETLDRELAAIESRLFASRSSLERAREEVKAREQELARLEAQQQARGEGESRALDAVMGMDGVHGTIATLGKAPKEYASALGIAAGGKLGYLVVEDDEVAAQAIAFLKEQKLGRLTFLPLTKLKPPSLSRITEKGIIDYAVNLLEFDPRYEPAFRVVFGTTVVVDTLDRARKLLGRYRMVTVEGELLEKTGVMSGGYQKKGRGFGVAVADDLLRVRVALNEAGKEVADHEGVIRSLTAEVDRKRGDRATLIEEITRQQTLRKEAEKHLAALQQERASLEGSFTSLREEVKGGADLLTGLESRIGAINDEIATRMKEIDALKKKMDDSQVPALMEQMEKFRQEMGEVERRLRNKESDITDGQRERQYFSKRVEELEGERQRVVEKNTTIDGEVTASEQQIRTLKDEIKGLESRLKEYSSDIEKLRGVRDKALEAVRAQERAITEMDTSMERVRLQIAALREREQGIRQEIEQLRKEAAGSPETEFTIEQVETRLLKVNEELHAMGAVNMLAIEEYDRVKGRVDERTEKKEVLSRERTTLIERIERFEQMKYDAFMNAFREIDTNFRAIFARLTSGNGHLVLLNEEDPFSGGLTFAVHPQDKKVHLLSALSGGEKSIVTLSFIFAIQKFMPAPFYAMDEIDMFLDGSNVERIATMIKELAGNAQSIIVSLRKPMIEKADRILGVTLHPDKSTLVTGVKGNG